MSNRVHVDVDAPRPITWPHLGEIGTIQRHAIDAAHLRWIARTPAGVQSRPLATQDDAAFWLRIQADPALLETPKPPADPVLEMIEAATGWKMTAEEVIEVGGRIQATRQMFNAREGAIRHEMPQRAIGSPPLSRGAAGGKSIDAETMAQGYYEGIGYGQDGVPTAATLESLGLGDLVADLAISTGAPARLVNDYLYSGAALKKGEKSKPAIGG